MCLLIGFITENINIYLAVAVEITFTFFFSSVGMHKDNKTFEDLELTDTDWAQRNKAFRKIRLRNRWHLYKMMVLNPSLIKYRYKAKIKKGKLSNALCNLAKFDLDLPSTIVDEKRKNSDNNNTTLKILIEPNSENEFDEATVEQETAKDSVQVHSDDV